MLDCVIINRTCSIISAEQNISLEIISCMDDILVRDGAMLKKFATSFSSYLALWMAENNLRGHIPGRSSSHAMDSDT